jgi:very-short-patch-repair endonuclease
MTPAEKILWEELRANKLGVHFRRQQVIAGFIVDFYCHPVKITRGLRQVCVGC